MIDTYGIFTCATQNPHFTRTESIRLPVNMKLFIVVALLYSYASVADLLKIKTDSISTDLQMEDDNTVQNILEEGDVPSTMGRLLGEMRSMVTRLADSEKRIQQLEAVVTQQKSEINDLISTVTQQKSTIAQQGSSLSELKSRPKVAFSASLFSSGNTEIGPFPGDTILVFRTVFTNDGNAYSPATGIFTAPVVGVYYFRFTAFSVGYESKRVSLLKNGQSIIIITGTYLAKDPEDSSSNAVVLKLDQGDEVHLVLHDGHQVYDDVNHHTTFSGFLLYGSN